MIARRALFELAASSAAMTTFASAARAGPPNTIPGMVNIQGKLPKLAFRMERVSDGRLVTGQNYRNDVVILYFGFVRCTDTCALTTYNAAKLFDLLDRDKARVRYLFVTVDLDHDKPPVLKRYLAEFGPPPYIDGLYGTPAELRALTKRYGVYYKAPTNPNSPDPEAGIVHSSAVYLFDPGGQVRAIMDDFGNGNAHLPALAREIGTVLHPSFWQQIGL